jgi:CRP-like cAMP-binding protein
MSNFPQFDCKYCTYKINCIYEVLKEEERELLNEKKVVKKYTKKETIYKEGRSATSCFFILDGGVSLSKEINVENPFFLVLKKSGSIIGLESIGYNVTYNSTALCVSDTTCCTVTSSLMFHLIKNNKEACSFFSFQYNHFINGLVCHLITLGTEKANVRIARSLLTLFEISKKASFNIKVNELATMSSTTRETTSRILASMKAMKMITITNRGINICDEQSLKDIYK